MNIIAFDPGTEIIGASYLKGPSGNQIVWVKELKLKGDLVDRYREAAHQVDEAIQEVDEVEYCAIETPFVGRNPSAAIKLGTIRGLILCRIFYLLPEVQIIDVAPQEIRRVFNLPIKSKKEEYHKIIHKHYDGKIIGDTKEDGLDAIAVGLTGATKVRKDLWWEQNA
jgi:Holliday junction resolvasome RuvABC endonuclease subunit